MKKKAFKIIEKLDIILPKKNQIIFNSFPDYSDNSYSLFRYMIEKKYHNKYTLVWLSYGDKKKLKKKIYDEFGIRIKVKKKNSIGGVFEYLKSNYTFCTHGLFGKAKSYNEKKRINLWHGMPLKKIGLLDDRCSASPYKQDYLISTSTLYQDLMAKSFGVNKEKVLITGQPRNDLFFEKTDFFEKVNLKKYNYKNIIMWMPTFRQSIIKGMGIDGEINHQKISLLSLSNLDILNKILETNNDLLLVKLHPMDILNNQKFEKYSNIIIIKSDDLNNLNVQLYSLLGNCDVLITDYSSVYIDYEILNRPVIFTMGDFESYKNSRGFVFGDNTKNYMPGTIVQTEEEFLELIKNQDFKIVKSKVELNKYKDNKSCERILKELGI